MQRDVRDLARIASLDALPRLLALAAGQTARLLNVTDLAGPFHLSRPTIRDYVTLLERVFLIEELPPWHGNRLGRLVKTPKLHAGDTGVAAALLGLDAEALYEDRETLGQLLETFVYQELRRHASGHEENIRFHHFREKDRYEVDLVVERGGRQAAGVEVKAAATVTHLTFVVSGSWPRRLGGVSPLVWYFTMVRSARASGTVSMRYPWQLSGKPDEAGGAA